MLARALIMWMVRRTDWCRRHDMTQWLDGVRNTGSMHNRTENERVGLRKRVAIRRLPFLQDEIQRGDDTIHRALPWWAPLNIILHQWAQHDDILMHDHPRRTATIVLRGEIIERTPWGERRLRAGSVVVRGHRYIHGFRVEREHSCRTWTLFIVGRRRHLQNTYHVLRRTGTPQR
jgi:hypothetical protein